MVVPIEIEPTFTAGTPEVVFEGSYFNTGGRHYDIAPDGERFLMIKLGGATNDASTPQVTVVQNWFEELKARVPIP